MFLTCIYCASSHSLDEFDDFSTKFELFLWNINHEFPLRPIVMGDFNARCWRWWQNDITNSAGQEIDSLTWSPGNKQIIDKPNHNVNNSISWIDLLSCTNQNTISNYGVDDSVFNKCHHNLIFGKVNIRVPLPPVYIREVWSYSQANVKNVKYATSNFNWSKAFVDGKVEHLNETLLNIFRNYIRNKKIKCDYRQSPYNVKNLDGVKLKI